MISACKFCGQTALIETENEAEALHLATMGCNCEEALNYREIYTRAAEAVEEMQELYREERVQERIIAIFREAIDLMALGIMTQCNVTLPNGKKLKISKRGNGFTINCARSDSKQVSV